jgi:hypothetical protein
MMAQLLSSTDKSIVPQRLRAGNRRDESIRPTVRHAVVAASTVKMIG